MSDSKLQIIIKDNDGELKPKLINNVSVIKDNIVKTVNNIYIKTSSGIKLVWTVVKDTLSAFGLGYWINDEYWDNSSGWKNKP